MGHANSRFPTSFGFIACCQRYDRLGVINTVPPDGGKLWHLTGSKQRNLLMTGDDDDKMFMTRSLNVTLKTTDQRLIARSDKPVIYVTNKK